MATFPLRAQFSMSIFAYCKTGMHSTRLLIDQGEKDTLEYFDKAKNWIEDVEDNIYSEINLIENLNILDKTSNFDNK